MQILHVLVPVLGVVGLAIACGLFLRLLKQSGGSGLVASIGAEIHSGAMIFMRHFHTGSPGLTTSVHDM